MTAPRLSVSLSLSLLIFALGATGCATAPARDPRDPAILHERAPAHYPTPR